MRVLNGLVTKTPQYQNQAQVSPGRAMTPEEQHLLQRVARQDQEAFDALYTWYAPQVRGYLRQRLVRHDLIDDVLQEVMLVLWQHAAQVPATVPLAAWLYGVARHKAFKTMARASAPTVPPAIDEAIDSDEPESVMLRQEHGRALAQVVDTLPYGERIVVRLVLARGYSYQEIATATGDPVSTIRTRISRARQRLRTRLAALERHAS